MITHLSTSKIVRGTNARASNDADSTLIKSIEKLGIIEPLVVSAEIDGKHILIAGNRRLSAAEQLALETVPVVVRDLATDDPMVTLAENMVRLDLTPLEIANYVAATLKLEGIVGKDIAQAIGKSESWISKCKKIAKTYEKASDKDKAYMAEFTNGEELYQYCQPKKKTAVAEHTRSAAGKGEQSDLVDEETKERQQTLCAAIAESLQIPLDNVTVEYCGEQVVVALQLQNEQRVRQIFEIESA